MRPILHDEAAPVPRLFRRLGRLEQPQRRSFFPDSKPLGASTFLEARGRVAEERNSPRIRTAPSADLRVPGAHSALIHVRAMIVREFEASRPIRSGRAGQANHRGI